MSARVAQWGELEAKENVTQGTRATEEGGAIREQREVELMEGPLHTPRELPGSAGGCRGLRAQSRAVQRAWPGAGLGTRVDAPSPCQAPWAPPVLTGAPPAHRGHVQPGTGNPRLGASDGRGDPSTQRGMT